MDVREATWSCCRKGEEKEKTPGKLRGMGKKKREERRDGKNSIPPPSKQPHKAVGSLTRRRKNFYQREADKKKLILK